MKPCSYVQIINITNGSTIIYMSTAYTVFINRIVLLPLSLACIKSYADIHAILIQFLFIIQ